VCLSLSFGKPVCLNELFGGHVCISQSFEQLMCPISQSFDQPVYYFNSIEFMIYFCFFCQYKCLSPMFNTDRVYTHKAK
jgi:hypothetical protein